MKDPVGVLAASVHHAVLVGLKPAQYEQIEWGEDRKGRRTGVMIDRRPFMDETECVMFSQSWGNTSMGFGGIGGQAITPAYTVVVYGPNRDACVYFGGRFAYHIERINGVFLDDVQSYKMHAVTGAKELYESKP